MQRHIIPAHDLFRLCLPDDFDRRLGGLESIQNAERAAHHLFPLITQEFEQEWIHIPDCFGFRVANQNAVFGGFKHPLVASLRLRVPLGYVFHRKQNGSAPPTAGRDGFAFSRILRRPMWGKACSISKS